jgi:uncharacterized protein (DUF302 family)
MYRPWRLVGFALSLLLACVHPGTGHATGAKRTVYVNLADSLAGSFDEATAALRGAFTAAGWEVVAVHDVALDRRACAYRARVIVLDDPRYTREVLAFGARAAFVLPPRLALYEDERGLHLATVDPLCVGRTIVAESGFEGPAERLLRELTRIASGAVRGRFAVRPFGQTRERGLIGRTMGVMAGGPFLEKLDDLHGTPGETPEDVARVAERVWKGLETPGPRWGLHGIYRLDRSAQGVVVIGVSGAAMESKSFAIVGAGSDERRAGFRCPGAAHAAAYPIEVVVFREGGQVHVAVVDGMYRMKMFFEDAGKMKFAANMGMPGSIEDELRARVLAELAPTR